MEHDGCQFADWWAGKLLGFLGACAALSHGLHPIPFLWHNLSGGIIKENDDFCPNSFDFFGFALDDLALPDSTGNGAAE